MNILAGLKVLGSLIADPLKGYVERKKIETETKAKIAEVQAHAAVDLAAKGQDYQHLLNVRHIDESGWKDEFWTIVLAIPAILCFIPEMTAYVVAGFAALEMTPDWFVYFLGTAIAAAFGRRQISAVIRDSRLKKVTA